MRIARWVAGLPPGARVGAAYLDLWWNGRLDTPDHDVMALRFFFSFSLPTFGIMVLFFQKKKHGLSNPFPTSRFRRRTESA